jgi:hypothetical protein
MNFQDLISHFGSQSSTAKAVGTSPQVVSMWKKNGIPIGRQFEIQFLTGGVLRADVVQRNQQQP